MKIKARACAKINWALNIRGIRPDGYHELDMLMQTIDLGDDMVFEESEDIALIVDGLPAVEPEKNLVVRAARALQLTTGTAKGARIALDKSVPARAGLGGGSADCALTLQALNVLWKLGLDDETLLRIGAKLGADVPFCLTGGLARVRGIGERIDPIADAPEIPLALVTPGGGLSTAEVFGLWDRGGFGDVALDVPALRSAVVKRELDAVDRLCANALTAPALSLMPEIGEFMRQLRKLGGRAVFMTGSGSTVVAAFDDPPAGIDIPGAVLTRTRAALPDIEAIP